VLPADVQPGDAVVGFASGGLRCNGYSLARRALLDVDGRDLGGPAWAGAGHSLADELLRPSVVYAPSVLELRRHVDVHAYAHVTGGGIVGNLARVLPDHCDAVVRRDAWERPRIFAEVQAAGAVTDGEMEEVFNLGLGMLAVVPGDAVNPALDAVRSAGHQAWAVGEITSGRGHAHMG
jgi:phosphoribosylformylglycinamidine cyclo-ligase